MTKEKHVVMTGWDTWNPIRVRCYEFYEKDDDYNGSFKQWMVKKSSKMIMKSSIEKYLIYCQNKGMDFDYIACAIKDGIMYIELETTNKRIASHLSFQANTKMNLIDYNGYEDTKLNWYII